MRHAFLAAALSAAAVTAQAPVGYYASVDASTPTTLRATLHAVIDDHTVIPYTAGGTDTWDVLELADQNPNNSSQILDLYRNATFGKQGGGNSFYNREHTWPNSYGFPTTGDTPYSDCHHLFLCDIGYNSDRGNRPFANGLASWTERPTLANAGQGGGSGTFPGNSNWFASNGWQVWGARKGDVARAMFYMDVRYEGGGGEPDLRLTDTQSLIQSTSGGIAYMGLLNVLLQWHQQDPVDAREMARNDVVFSFQGNRNPFVDHPEWVECFYLGVCAPPVTGRVPEIWINELHYDNAGTDVGEFVEVAGRAGTSLKDWLLLGYDGTTGNWYGLVRLGGTIPNQQNGFGTLAFDFPGLQNGSPDGIALVTSNGIVMQFVSYEGSFTAVGGAADGLTSTDLGVAQTGSTGVNLSLQLVGSGSSYAQFGWNPGVLFATKGLVNVGQTFP